MYVLVKYQDEVEEGSGAGLVEDVAEEEGSGALGGEAVAEVSVEEAGVVALEAGVEEGSEEEADHRAFHSHPSSVRFFSSPVIKSTFAGESRVVILSLAFLLFLMCNLSTNKVSDLSVDPRTGTLHVVSTAYDWEFDSSWQLALGKRQFRLSLCKF